MGNYYLKFIKRYFKTLSVLISNWINIDKYNLHNLKLYGFFDDF